MGAAAKVFDGWRLWRSVSIAIGQVEDWSGVVQVGGHHLLFPGPLGAEVGKVVADLGSVPLPQAGLLGPVVVAPQVAPSHQAVAVSADELHRDQTMPATRRAQPAGAPGQAAPPVEPLAGHHDVAVMQQAVDQSGGAARCCLLPTSLR